MSTTDALSPAPARRQVAWDDDLERGDHYEIIDGHKVELPPMSANSSTTGNDLAHALNSYGLANNVGKGYTEVLIHLPLPEDRNRKPDVIFVPFGRWPQARRVPATNAWDVLPDLCAEVVSPSDLAEDNRTKVEEYLRAGVRLVWVVYPELAVVDMYGPAGQLRVLRRTDTLDGGDVLPGFRLPLADLFPVEVGPPAPPTPPAPPPAG